MLLIRYVLSGSWKDELVSEMGMMITAMNSQFPLEDLGPVIAQFFLGSLIRLTLIILTRPTIGDMILIFLGAIAIRLLVSYLL